MANQHIGPSELYCFETFQNICVVISLVYVRGILKYCFVQYIAFYGIIAKYV